MALNRKTPGVLPNESGSPAVLHPSSSQMDRTRSARLSGRSRGYRGSVLTKLQENAQSPSFRVFEKEIADQENPRGNVGGPQRRGNETPKFLVTGVSGRFSLPQPLPNCPPALAFPPSWYPRAPLSQIHQNASSEFPPPSWLSASACNSSAVPEQQRKHMALFRLVLSHAHVSLSHVLFAARIGAFCRIGQSLKIPISTLLKFS